MKYLIVLLYFSFTVLKAVSQSMVVVSGSKPDLFIKHKIAPKENLYSIGRMYNSSPSVHIAPYNKMQLNDILKDNQIIHIPLTANNFTQTKKAPDTMVLVPVYYIVQPKDGLNKIAIQHGTSAANIKSWTGLNSEVMKVGQKLIIGYLIVHPKLSSLASNTLVNKGLISNNTKPITNKSPVSNPTPNNVVKQEAKPSTIKNEVKNNTPYTPTSVSKMNTTSVSDDDYFKSYYTGVGNVNRQVSVAPFYSNVAGKKYYVLMNLVSAGTIIKITNSANKKVVYAQVLAGLENTDYNTGVQMRLNEGALEALSIGKENKLINLSISY